MRKYVALGAVFFSALAMAQQTGHRRDAPKTVSFQEFLGGYQLLQRARTEVQISGVYDEYASADWLYADLETADSHSLTPSEKGPISLWLGERNLTFALRHHVTLVGHVDSCVEWQTNVPSEGLVIHSVPTNLNPNGVPSASPTMGCLVVDQAYVH